MKDYMHFHNYMNMVRSEKKVTMEQLCYGLCSKGSIHYYETGERIPNYKLRNRIMGRLGISSEGYEDFVHYDEYEYWLQEQDLMDLVETRQTTEGLALLETMKQSSTASSPIERQFLLDMYARLRKQSGEMYVGMYYKEAVELTIPMFSFEHISQYLLSAEEYFYILTFLFETLSQRNVDIEECRERIRSVIEHLRGSNLDDMARAKIYPYAISVLGKTCLNQSEIRSKWFQGYLEEALECLRKTKRLYECFDLFRLRRREKVRTEKWVEVYRSLFQKYNVPEETNAYCYLYNSAEVYCDADVITSRRQAMGLSRKQLSLCGISEKTIERIELKKTKPQPYTLSLVFGFLGVCGDFRRESFAVSNVEEHEDLLKLLRNYYAGNNKMAEKELKKLRCKLDMEVLVNKQTYIVMLNAIEQRLQLVDSRRMARNLEVALQLSLKTSLHNIIEKTYLSSMERSCLRGIALVKEQDFLKQLVIDKQKTYAQEGRFRNMYPSLETSLLEKASILGNKKEYSESEEDSEKVIITSLLTGRDTGIERALYNRAWNRSKQMHEWDAEAIEMLRQCVILCDYTKAEGQKEFYVRKLKSVESCEPGLTH